MSKESDYDSEDDDIPELDSVSSSEVRWYLRHDSFAHSGLVIKHVRANTRFIHIGHIT